MKILVIGGYSPSLINFRGHLLQSMVGAGHEVHAAAPGLLADGPTCERLRAIKVVPHDVPLKRAGLNPFVDLVSLGALISRMGRLKPDAILAYTVKPVVWGMLAARIAGVRHRFALITGLGYAFAAQSSGKRALVSRVARWLYRIALTGASKVFFQNADDAQLFDQLRLVPEATPKIVVSGSGVDVEEFAPRPLPEGPTTFLLIARLLGDKGIREYFEAAESIHARFPDAAFDLVGPPDESPDGISPRELDHLLAGGHVRWRGEAVDVRPHIANCHVYVLPSYREGTPRTVLEAMALGRPIITTDAPGCRETVVEGLNGWLVEPRSAISLAEAMTRFIEAPEMAAPMGRESRRLVEERYDVRLVSRDMLHHMGMA